MRVKSMLVLTVTFAFFAMTVFTACAQSANAPIESSGVTETTASETQETRIYPDLPDVKYDGAEIASLSIWRAEPTGRTGCPVTLIPTHQTAKS